MLFLSCAIPILAQDKGYILGVAAEAGSNLGGNNGFSPLSYTLSPGYSLDGKWYVAVPLTVTNELITKGDFKTYRTNANVGLSAGYNLLKRDNNIVIFSAAVGGTVYAEADKSLYYDLCAKWGTAARFKPLVGLGLRYYQTLGDSRANDHLCIYASIGFRFN